LLTCFSGSRQTVLKALEKDILYLVIVVVFIRRKKEKEELDVCVEDKKSRFSIFGNRKRC
jgi:hypothetical protein